MRKHSWYVALLFLLATGLACGFPYNNTDAHQTETASSVLVAAAQTIAAQQMAETATALVISSELNATANAQLIGATQTALSHQATALSDAANATAISQNATATAQILAATVAAGDAQATAFAQSLTATALAYHPPTPLPPTVQMTRLSFASGATSTYVDGQIFRDQSIDYVLRALNGQTMLANVYSPNNNVYLGIVGLSDGNPLMRTAVAGTSFTGTLPATQDYRITLFSPNQTTNYTLQIIIPVRIQFAPGAISDTVSGVLAGGETNYYLLRARAGQQMGVTIFSPANDIFLTIYGMQDGSPLVRSVMAMTSWTGILPATQDYMIQAVSTGAGANYTIQVIVQ